MNVREECSFDDVKDSEQLTLQARFSTIMDAFNNEGIPPSDPFECCEVRYKDKSYKMFHTPCRLRLRHGGSHC